MLHLLADSMPDPRPQPYAEAVARLASIRHALRLVEPCAGGPAGDVVNEDAAIALAWDEASGAKQRCFDRHSERVIASTASGLEALLAQRDTGHEPNSAANRQIADEIRVGLENLSRLMLGGKQGGAQFPHAIDSPAVCQAA